MYKLKEIISSWKRKDPNPTLKKEGRKVLKSKKKMPWNIYGSKTYGEEWRKFNWFHYFFKYKILVPLLKYTENKLEKQNLTRIPNEPHNGMILAFDTAYDKSLKEWCLYYRGGRTDKKGKQLKYNFKKQFSNDYAVRLLKTMKKVAISGYMTDTAYREFANMLFLNLYLELDKLHMNKKSITHLLYKSTDTRDVIYYSLFQKIEQMAMPLNAQPNFENRETVEITKNGINKVPKEQKSSKLIPIKKITK